MANIHFKVEGSDAVTVRGAAGDSILDLAIKAGIALDAPCGGNGTCGKCRVKLVAGKVEGGSGSRHISEKDTAEGWILACQSKVAKADAGTAGDIEIFVSAASLSYQSRIRITDIEGEREKAVFAELRERLTADGLTGDHGIEAADVELAPPSLEDPGADRERLLTALAGTLGVDESAVTLSLHAQRKLPRILREQDFKAKCILRKKADGAVVVLNVADRGQGTEDSVPSGSKPSTNADSAVSTDIANKKLSPTPYPLPTLPALAIDIGTTTISMLLVDLATGNPAAGASCGNGQIRYGADVINRIIESTKKGGMDKLRRAVIDESIAPLIRRLCVEAGIEPEDIVRVTVAGNTTMATLFLGVHAEFIRLEPYVPPFFTAAGITAGLAGLPVNPDAELLLAPSVGAYVGGDITAGVFSSGVYKKDTLTLFIDLGTNGEIVLGNSEFMMSCACSAGPAFEGGEISCGMRAAGGAIEACKIDEASMDITPSVIGGGKVAGLCGSGLIDIIGELFRCGIINAKGKFVREGKRIVKDEYGGAGYIAAFAAESESGKDVVLTEADIDNFIRAKGAIYSAIRTMLASLDFTQDDIEEVFVAGGIGSGIDIDHAIMIGMFPNISLEKYRYIGNSSLTGAYSMLCSNAATAKVAEIGSMITYLELSSHPGYMDEFIAACFIPHTDASLFAR